MTQINPSKITHLNKPIAVEVCINCDGKQSVRDAVAAANIGGASTVELCSAMHLDGLTPTREQIIQAREAFVGKAGLMVMIRPRDGGFCYAKEELQLMHNQIAMAAEAGADGVVLGVLRGADNCLAIQDLHELMETAVSHNLKTTFHRAFDATPNPLQTLDLLIEAGVARLLTSGTAWGTGETAVDGIETLRQVLNRAKGRIEIVIGGGVNGTNVGTILKQLPFAANKVSLHAYSGAQENGITTFKAVKALVDAVQSGEDLVD